jgi:ABC-type multidrug transport system permease subunit
VASPNSKAFGASVIDISHQQKQYGFAMYHPGIDAISSLISMWPIKFISTTLFNLVLYFLADLKREPGAFFIFLLFTYTSVLLMTALFRFVAAITKHEATAVSIAGVLLLALVIYTGCKFETFYNLTRGEFGS